MRCECGDLCAILGRVVSKWISTKMMFEQRLGGSKAATGWGWCVGKEFQEEAVVCWRWPTLVLITCISSQLCIQ